MDGGAEEVDSAVSQPTARGASPLQFSCVSVASGLHLGCIWAASQPVGSQLHLQRCRRRGGGAAPLHPHAIKFGGSVGLAQCSDATACVTCTVGVSSADSRGIPSPPAARSSALGNDAAERSARRVRQPEQPQLDCSVECTATPGAPSRSCTGLARRPPAPRL